MRSSPRSLLQINVLLYQTFGAVRINVHSGMKVRFLLRLKPTGRPQASTTIPGLRQCRPGRAGNITYQDGLLAGARSNLLSFHLAHLSSPLAFSSLPAMCLLTYSNTRLAD